MRRNWRKERVESKTSRLNVLRSTARTSARRSALAKGIPFHIPTSDDLPELPENCPVCGVWLEPGGSRNNSPSLDRILPSLGYTVENVWWICHDCNRQKADLDPARAYRLWDRVWDMIEERGLPTPATRRKP